MKPGRMFTLLFIEGGILGVILVRAFILDPFEVLGWQMFWSGLAKGDMMDINMVLQSTTFAKCLSGFIIGSLASGFIWKFYSKKVK